MPCRRVAKIVGTLKYTVGILYNGRVVLSSCVCGIGVWCCQHIKLIHMAVTFQPFTQIITIDRSVADVCNLAQML